MPDWTREAILDAVREDATDGIAPSAGDWRRDPTRPSSWVITAHFGSWSNLVAEAGLRTKREVKHAAARTRVAEQTEGPTAKRRRQQREAKQAALEQQVRDGMTVRRLTAADLAALEQAKRRRRDSPAGTLHVTPAERPRR
jgi:hypothetical protein